MTRRAGTNNQMFLVRTFSYFRYKKTGGDVSGFFLFNAIDYATSSYCGTGLRKLLVTQAR